MRWIAALDANRTASIMAAQIGGMLVEAEAAEARQDQRFGVGAGGKPMPGRSLK